MPIIDKLNKNCTLKPETNGVLGIGWWLTVVGS